MTWVRLVDGIPRYTYKLSRPASFDVWADNDGRDVVEELASRRAFALFGRKRAVKNELWNELRAAAEQGTLAITIARVVEGYLRSIGDLAVYAAALPRTTIELRRIVVVPRVVCNTSAFHAITGRMEALLEQAVLRGGSRLRDFFYMELLKALDAALVATTPSIRNPIQAAAGWAIVGVDQEFSWWVPPRAEDEWRGHYLLYEPPPGGLKRSSRKAVEGALAEIANALPNLSRMQRLEIVNEASRTMPAQTEDTSVG